MGISLKSIESFSSNAPRLLKRESNFTNCADIVVNTRYDPATDEISGFENQASHHGGLGGQQSYPFIFYPASLPFEGKPIIGAVAVNHLLSGWRKAIQFNKIRT